MSRETLRRAVIELRKQMVIIDGRPYLVDELEAERLAQPPLLYEDGSDPLVVKVMENEHQRRVELRRKHKPTRPYRRGFARPALQEVAVALREQGPRSPGRTRLPRARDRRGRPRKEVLAS